MGCETSRMLLLGVRRDCALVAAEDLFRLKSVDGSYKTLMADALQKGAYGAFGIHGRRWVGA